MALGALDERTSSSRYILDDLHVYGLTDPDRLRAQIEGEDEATAVFRDLLDDGDPTGTRMAHGTEPGSCRNGTRERVAATGHQDPRQYRRSDVSANGRFPWVTNP